MYRDQSKQAPLGSHTYSSTRPSHGQNAAGPSRGRGSGRGRGSERGRASQGWNGPHHVNEHKHPADNGYSARHHHHHAGFVAPGTTFGYNGGSSYNPGHGGVGPRTPSAYPWSKQWVQKQHDRLPRAPPPPDKGLYGHFVCGVDLGNGGMCAWRSSSDLSITLHRADRHLIYPPGGIEALEHMDPLLVEERREKMRRARKRTIDDEAEDSNSSLIPGLNIQLNTPELISKWIEERKKRWPTAAAVERKKALTWADPQQRRHNRHSQSENDVKIDDPAFQLQGQAEEGNSQPDTKDLSTRSSNSSSEASSDEEELSDESSSGSDVDEERDAVSSKIPPMTASAQPASTCRFYARGQCRDGDKCRFSHNMDKSSGLSQDKGGYAVRSTEPPRKRQRPRAGSPNPFDAPHLLRALLRNEIAQHVNYVAQVVRFIVRNNFLSGFERKVGDAETQKRRRNLVAVVSETDPPEAKATKDITSGDRAYEAAVVEAPLAKGGLPILGKGLFQPQSPTLTPLTELSLPPEPDEFVLMDPLRAQDAKPLTHEQHKQLAQDDGIRTLLLDDMTANQSVSGDGRKLSPSMVRALQTLDSLPTYAHRASAIELMLGVSEQSVHHAHQLGPTYIRADRMTSSSINGGSSGIAVSASSLAGQAGGPARVIGENELFRLGLRAGPAEVAKIRQLAGRVSAIIGGPEFADDAETELHPSEDIDSTMRPWWDEATRHEMRRQQWTKQGQWRDQMRKLGLEID